MDPKSILLWFMFKNVQPMFFFRLVIISHLTYRPLTHFEFILIYGIREYSNTNKSKTIDKMTYISIITLNVKIECSNQNKLSGWMDTETRPVYMLLTRDSLHTRRYVWTGCNTWLKHLDAISKMTEWSLFVSKANHSITR